MKLAALLIAASLLLPAFARAGSPSVTVRGFFDALERKDFGRALALTGGDASLRITRLLGHIDAEAAQHHAQVEFKVRSLSVEERAPADSGEILVDVSYDIDVIGKKWIFRKVARKLTGTAQFFVDASAPRIVAIVGSLEP
ncbi:MAG TPA: hypothetical protein VFF06_24550 [Polyangia bacterium]|nr:hypothetical protein [Polyangia bacterium]